MQQIPLAIKLETSNSFDEFYCENHNLIANIKAAIELKESIYITGFAGKTHLLQAICKFSNEHNKPCFFMPMAEFIKMPVAVTQFEQKFSVVCVDDIDLIVGNAQWEQAMFDLINDLIDNQACIVVSCSNYQTNFNLPDLKSRIKQLRQIFIPKLTDSQVSKVFLLHAKFRGLNVKANVAKYIHRHLPRNIKYLINLLDMLENMVVLQKRKITIELVKDVVASQNQ